MDQNAQAPQQQTTQQFQQPLPNLPQPPTEKKKRGCFWWIGLIVIILVVLAILAALRRNNKTTSNSTATSSTSTTSSNQQSSNTTTSTQNSSLPQVYRNAIGGYQIHYPSGWIVDSAAVAVVGVAFRESDTDDAPAVDVYAIPNNDNLTLEQAKTTYTNGSALLGSSNILSFRIKSQNTTTFQGLDAYQVVTTFKSKLTNEDTQGKMIVFQHAGRNYALYAHATASTFSQKEATLDSIINSFSTL